MASPRLFDVLRVFGAVSIAGFVLTGTLIGLRQQVTGLEADQVDCDYRVRILRDRLLNTMERPILSARAEDAFDTLLRETRAACADRDPELNKKLNEIQGIADQAKAWRTRSAEARAALRAL
jgi:hypothetical protein